MACGSSMGAKLAWAAADGGGFACRFERMAERIEGRFIVAAQAR